MADINGTAARYRQRAEQRRVLADAKGSTEIREQLLDLAVFTNVSLRRSRTSTLQNSGERFLCGTALSRAEARS